MKEKEIRSFHRRVGIFLALFIFIQIATGTALSIHHLFANGHRHDTQYDVKSENSVNGDETKEKKSGFEEVLEFSHRKGGVAGDLYRTVLGLGLIYMIISGAMINREIKKRTKRRTA